MSITGILEQNAKNCMYAGIDAQANFTNYAIDAKGGLFFGAFGDNVLAPTSVSWNGDYLIINESGVPAFPGQQ